MPWGTNDSRRITFADTRVVLALLLVVSLLLCALYSRESETGFLHRIQGGFGTLYTPITSGGVAIDESVAESQTAASDARATDLTLSELEARIAELEAQIALDEEYVLECQRLQAMLSMVNMYDIQGTAARVIARDSEPYSKVITAAAGTNAGVAIGDTVIGSYGVVGQVISVSANSCDIRLVSDQDSGIAVMIQYNRREGIVKGSLEGLMYLEDVDSTVLVQVGDVLVTSGLGGSYVRGLIVGQVIKVTESVGDASRLIVVTPQDDLDSITEVFIVKSMGSWGAAV